MKSNTPTVSLRVKFVGHVGERQLGPYTWNEENDWTVAVTDPETLNIIRNYPYPQFQILDDEVPAPDRQVTVLSGLGPARAAELADLNIHTIGQLIEAGAEFVTANTGASRTAVAGWFEQASKMMEAANG